jgi:hypothetical protein
MNAHIKPTSRPVAFQGDLDNLPEALAPLKALPNWVCWKWEWKVNKKGIGKWDKPPYNPKRPHEYAKNNHPATWGTYEQALAVFQRGQCDGIGFNLSGTEFAAFDLDKCRNHDSASIAPEGMAIVDRATSYTEYTVSGTGLRVIGYGAGKKIHRKQKVPNSCVEIESYSRAERYIVITGNPLPNTWPHVCDISSVMEEVVAELDGKKQDNAPKLPIAEPNVTALPIALPEKLQSLIFTGPGPSADLSADFHHAVNWLSDYGWSATRIEAYITGKPIVPERYSKRLRNEIERCLAKSKPKQERPASAPTQPPPQPIEIFWHGKTKNNAPRSWLVKDLIPERGKGLASGQWGAAKTFCMLDLAASTMTAAPFAGREVARRGGVLFVAAEGATEIPIRLQGLVEHKLQPAALATGAMGSPIAADLEALPFAWIEETPDLKDENSFKRLKDAAKSAALNLREQFDLPLVLIIVDTLSASANFKDQNDSAEGQFVMNRLGELSRDTGAFVLAVDHFGKAVETGTRGASAKEGSADVVLALLADREVNGTISNTRMALRKLRGGKTGAETPFNLNVVDLGNGDTTCVIEWRAERAAGPVETGKKDRWPKSLRVFRSALAAALADKGKMIRPFAGEDGPLVRAVTDNAVRDELLAAYPGDTPDAKRKAFKRSLKTARDSGLICSREIAGVDHLWLTDGTTKPDTTRPDRQDTSIVSCPVRPVVGVGQTGQMSGLSG